MGRLLHDRTADKIAAVVSRIPHAAATIVPFDVQSRLQVLHARQVAQAERTAAGKTHIQGLSDEAARDERAAAAGAPPADPAEIPGRDNAGREPAGQSPEDQAPGGHETAGGAGEPGTGADGGAPGMDASGGLPAIFHAPSGLRRVLRGRRRGADQPPPAGPADDQASYDRPAPSAGASPIGSLVKPGRATVEGRIRAVEIRPVERNSVLAVDVADSTGDLTALFYGRSHVPGIDCGARVRFRGPVGLRPEGPVMINPAYELLSGSATRGTLGEDSSGGKPPGPGRPDDGPDDGPDA
jgi:hypothetical protein